MAPGRASHFFISLLFFLFFFYDDALVQRNACFNCFVVCLFVCFFHFFKVLFFFFCRLRFLQRRHFIKPRENLCAVSVLLPSFFFYRVLLWFVLFYFWFRMPFPLAEEDGAGARRGDAGNQKKKTKKKNKEKRKSKSKKTKEHRSIKTRTNRRI